MRDAARLLTPAPTDRADRASGIFETEEDLDRARWSTLDRRIDEALARIGVCDRLGVDKNLRDAVMATARIREWCGELSESSLDDKARSILSRSYRWTAMLADDLADVAEDEARSGSFPLGAYAELAASCFLAEVQSFGDMPLLGALERHLRCLVGAVRG